MKLLISLLLLSLVACGGKAPVKPDWPLKPETKKCPDLNLIPEDTKKRSDEVKIQVQNNALYHECKASNEAWDTWYTKQKEIYNSIK
jgi:hypothetical protein